MNDMILKYHSDLVKQIAPSAKNIRDCNVHHIGSKILFADTDSGITVYRFPHNDIVHRNKIISDFLIEHNVPVPKTTIYQIDNTLVETYAYNHDKTLAECIRTGISKDKIQHVYKSVLDTMAKITNVSLVSVANEKLMQFWQLYQMHISGTMPRTLCNMATDIIRLMSYDKQSQHLFHNDLNPYNILVDKDENFSFLIDLDGFSICSTEFSMARLMRMMPFNNNFELAEYYAQKTNCDINTKRVKYYTALMNTLAHTKNWLKHRPRCK